MIDVDCVVLKKTHKAYLVKTDRDEEVWIPKSLCSGINSALIPENEFEDEEVQTISVKSWFAEKEGLV